MAYQNHPYIDLYLDGFLLREGVDYTLAQDIPPVPMFEKSIVSRLSPLNRVVAEDRLAGNTYVLQEGKPITIFVQLVGPAYSIDHCFDCGGRKFIRKYPDAAVMVCAPCKQIGNDSHPHPICPVCESECEVMFRAPYLAECRVCAWVGFQAFPEGPVQK